MANLGTAVIKWARGQVGTREKRRNIVPYWTQVKPAWQGEPWCGAFAAAGWLAQGIDIRPICNPYSASKLREWAQENGVWSTSAHDDGDIVVYTFGHIGLSWRDENASGYRAVEGNTSSGTAGSQSNGGGVYVRYRGRKSISGWVRMSKVIEKYNLAKAAGGKAVEGAVEAITGKLVEDGRLGQDTARELQQRLRTRDLDLAVDGKLGPDSFRAMQAYLRAPYIDGEISRQPQGAKDLGNGYRKDAISVGDGKSQFVERWQAYVGAKVDGRLGGETIRKTQQLMNGYAAAFTAADDGIVDKRIKEAGIK